MPNRRGAGLIGIEAVVPRALRTLALSILVGLGAALSNVAQAQEDSSKPGDSAELAKKLANPVAALISVPFQYNQDRKLVWCVRLSTKLASDEIKSFRHQFARNLGNRFG